MSAPRPHAKLAADTWRMIRALGMSRHDGKDEDFHEAAQNLIEMACDSAAESERFRRDGPRQLPGGER